MEALIVYAKIEVKQDIKSLKPKEGEEDKKEKKLPSYKEINYLSIEKELSSNRKLI
jgi:hypothetical protein